MAKKKNSKWLSWDYVVRNLKTDERYALIVLVISLWREVVLDGFENSKIVARWSAGVEASSEPETTDRGWFVWAQSRGLHRNYCNTYQRLFDAWAGRNWHQIDYTGTLLDLFLKLGSDYGQYHEEGTWINMLIMWQGWTYSGAAARRPYRLWNPAIEVDSYLNLLHY